MINSLRKFAEQMNSTNREMLNICSWGKQKQMSSFKILSNYTDMLTFCLIIAFLENWGEIVFPPKPRHIFKNTELNRKVGMIRDRRLTRCQLSLMKIKVSNTGFSFITHRVNFVITKIIICSRASSDSLLPRLSAVEEACPFADKES